MRPRFCSETEEVLDFLQSRSQYSQEERNLVCTVGDFIVEGGCPYIATQTCSALRNEVEVNPSNVSCYPKLANIDRIA